MTDAAVESLTIDPGDQSKPDTIFSAVRTMEFASSKVTVSFARTSSKSGAEISAVVGKFTILTLSLTVQPMEVGKLKHSIYKIILRSRLLASTVEFVVTLPLTVQEYVAMSAAAGEVTPTVKASP